MWCMKCKKHLSECVCDDLDERLGSLKNSGNVIYKMCRKCGLHYDRCKCVDPEWTTSQDGIEMKDVVKP